MKHYLIPFLIFASLVISCKKDLSKTEPILEPGVNKKIAPDGFNYATSKNISVSVRLLSNIDEPLKGIIVDINTTNGETLLRGASDANGYFKGSINIPSYIDTLSIDPINTGLIKDIKVLIVDNSLSCVIGGTSGASGNVIMSGKNNNRVYSGTTVFAPTTYAYMGTYDVNGRPVNYREATPGTVSANLLLRLSESLPNSQDIRVHHPQYVSTSAIQTLYTTQATAVYLTYVSESVNWAHTIGYYTYPYDTPPKDATKLSQVKMVFPNASAMGSGGNMQAGDRVNLGTFPAGTAIEFVIIQNGWNPTLRTVNTNLAKFYSNSAFNPEGTDALRRHTVLLNYPAEQLFVIGFEDILRSGTSSDHDFNDVILYAKSSVANAIYAAPADVATIAEPLDTDGDGVWNANDKFPTDASRAYITYFPSETTKGTLAFEDNWPYQGDYDMNDLVIKYRYTYVSNASNKIVEMTGNFMAVAAFAEYTNGFGVQFPFSPSLISSVTGQKLIHTFATLNANGTESGQSKAVIIPFDDHGSLIQNNTTITDSSQVKITFTSPVDLATLGNAPYNPFLITNKIRGYEIHLAGHPHTDHARLSIFGTQNDSTNPAANRYYLSTENWPWAISFLESFSYPINGAKINEAYLHFGEWASSGGTSFTDWYKNTAPGYREHTKIHN